MKQYDYSVDPMYASAWVSANRLKHMFCLVGLLLLQGIYHTGLAQICPIEIRDAEVGSCRMEGSTPRATVSVEVAWSGMAQPGELLEVEILNGTVLSTNPVMIDPAQQASPLRVSFEVFADGLDDHVIAANSSINCGTATSSPIAFPVACCQGNMITLCSDGVNTATLSADAGLTDIQWFNESGRMLGQTQSSLFIDLLEEPFAQDLADGVEHYYYTATDANGCTGILCCPVVVFTEVCYDLAFAKKLNKAITPGPFRSGDYVQYTFEITNQGTLPAYQVDITDYVPAGLIDLTYVANSVSSGTLTQSGNTFTLDEIGGTDSNGGDPVQVTFEVRFRIDPEFKGETIINSAEISAFFKDQAGLLSALDVDSSPDNIAEEDLQSELANNDVITDVDSGSSQDDDSIEDDFDAEEISLNLLVGVGNLIFQDANGDGFYNPSDGDIGLAGVQMDLYLDNGDGLFNPSLDTRLQVGPDGVPGTADDITGPYYSQSNGIYYFDQLEPGDYFIFLPGRNFEPDGVLNGYVSSLPEDNGDSMDDEAGENGQNTRVNDGIVSSMVSLRPNTEPMGESGMGAYDGLLDDDNVNQTIDFGFLRCSPITCNSRVMVGLEPGDTVRVTPNLLLTGTVLADPNWYEIYLTDKNGQPINGTTLTYEQAGQKLTFAIINPYCDDTPCVGELLLEDKSRPQLFAPADIELECWLADAVFNNAGTVAPIGDGPGPDSTGMDNDGGDGNALNDLGLPEAYDREGGNPLPFTFEDQITYFECDSANLEGLITRVFRTENANGKSATDTQRIWLGLVAPEEFTFQEDVDNSDGQTLIEVDGKWVWTVQNCLPDSVQMPVPYPVYEDAFGNRITLDQIACNRYSLNELTSPLEAICGDAYQAEKSFTLFDWCTGETIELFPYQLEYRDVTPPERAASTCAGFQLTAVSSEDSLLAALNGAIPSGLNQDLSCGILSTGPMNCTAVLDISLNGLENQFGDLVQDCSEDLSTAVTIFSFVSEQGGTPPSEDSTWVRGHYLQEGETIMGLAEGKHAMLLGVADPCNNLAHFVLFFEVVDLVKPTMKCVESLQVTLEEGDENLGIGGYASLTFQDIDADSRDNCSLAHLQVRRSFHNDSTGLARGNWIAMNDPEGMDVLTDAAGDRDAGDEYSPWADVVEFFCGDLTGDGVRVELRGTDWRGNSSSCWVEVAVENGTSYGVKLLGQSRRISCTAIPTDLSNIDEAFMNSLGIEAVIVGMTGCQVQPPRLDIDLSGLDRCRLGTITVKIDRSSVDTVGFKTPIPVSDRMIEIDVFGDHDYWIKFPADEKLSCTEESTNEIEFQSESCDLMALFEADERFESRNNSGACYRILRTFRVINWCEYDGESNPVIVSRDWDAHNAGACSQNRNPSNEGNNPRTDDAGEYNLNPLNPFGDGLPGDEDIYVIVDVNNRDEVPTDYTNDGETEAIDGELDIVYYDNNSNPFDQSTAGLYGDDNTDLEEGYWWAVIRGETACGTNESAWYAPNGDGGNDDTDNRYGSFGYWQYTQHLEIYDDSAPEAEIALEKEVCTLDGALCTAEVEFTVKVSDRCSREFLEITFALDGIDQGMALGRNDSLYSGTLTGATIGQHQLTVRIKDGCGNVTIRTKSFSVVDCKGPAPICQDGIVVNLLPYGNGEGRAEIQATSFIASPIEDCTALSNDDAGAGVVPDSSYRIFRDEGFISYDSAMANSSQPSTLIFSCADVGNAPLVRVYAEDAAGNVDYCVTFVNVQDNNNVCDGNTPTGDIGGLITTEDVRTIEGVEIQLSGLWPRKQVTEQEGGYNFENVVQGYDYTLTPFKDDQHSNGISTFDLVQIQKHILGTKPLDSPYKLIAADANNSKTISTLDLIQIRKLILRLDSEFQSNTSWRFVEASYEFPDPTNPWVENFPEFKNINNLDRRFTLANFVGVKIGDVNNTARANSAQEIQSRNVVGVLEVRTQEISMEKGNIYTVSFKADLSRVAGYQFTMEVDSSLAQMVDIQEGVSKPENFGKFFDRGILTTSFHMEDQEFTQNEVLFNLILQANANVDLSEVLAINSKYTPAEAYSWREGADFDDLAVELTVRDDLQDSGYALFQNRPNPFNAETVIGFNLPAAMGAILEFKDVSGRTLFLREGEYTKGYNELRIKSDAFPGSGMYFYTLYAGDFIATKKMIFTY